jgi:hypothetical protein
VDTNGVPLDVVRSRLQCVVADFSESDDKAGDGGGLSGKVASTSKESEMEAELCHIRGLGSGVVVIQSKLGECARRSFGGGANPVNVVSNNSSCF